VASSRRWQLPVALAIVGGLALATGWSYASGGLIYLLFTPADGTTRLETLRTFVLGWGALAPLVYVAIVVVEVLVAPFPGALLYAPGGALFGGLLGGTLSLIGNTVGAAIAAWIGAAFGEGWLAGRLEGSRLDTLRRRLETRGGWVVFLLRLNPLTSSDIVSYAAGLAGVRPLRVAMGTLAGMAPQCYVQAYLAATIFELLPDWAVVVFALLLLAVAAIVVLVLMQRAPGRT
jgi:uncharacterized membrane protein YdjX (TVP38/TMEM64 family)